MAADGVVSLAERLKQRRDERGISQAQAARELDVARTAYRLWEMEAAKPSPDRWRLIARWLGVSVTTMLLAEELLSEEEAAMGEVAASDFGRSGRDWDEVGAGKQGDFFAQARALIVDGTSSSDLTAEQAEALAFVFERIEGQRPHVKSDAWKAAEVRKTLRADREAPRAARDALSVVAEGVREELLERARLLVSELVTTSVQHVAGEPAGDLGLFVRVDRDRLHVEVSAASPSGARPRAPSEEAAELATRWGAGREGTRNVTWFEIDLEEPGERGATRSSL
jgi:transcriptional regulator with XRE-family HTH domain